MNKTSTLKTKPRSVLRFILLQGVMALVTSGISMAYDGGVSLAKKETAFRIEKTSLEKAFQENVSVTGTITDAGTQQAIPGVNIIEKGTTNGTTTDADGRYALSGLDDDAVLIFSFIGYNTEEVAVNGRSVIDIALQEDAETLEEVVVIGYGTAKRQDFTGSVSSVRLEDSPLSQIANLNVLQSLRGNVPGLDIGPTNSAGGQPSMMIRGQNSINGSNNPLIVLDGVIFLGSLSDINPNDIATIDVLKDAVSAAAYGSRSANGVIAITTKKGKIGKPVITFNTYAGIQTWQNKPVMMKGEEWISVVNARNKYTEGSTDWLKAGELENLEAGRETVWLDEVSRTGVIQDYQVGISGGAEKVNYYLSASYADNEGIIVGDDFTRKSILGKLNTAITDWLEVGVDASYAIRDYSGFAANVGSAQTMSPYGVMFRDDRGNLEKYPYTQSSVNPLWGVQDGTRENSDVRHAYRINAYATISVPWVKGLSYRINMLTNVNKNQSWNFTNENYFIAEGAGLDRYQPSTVVGFLTNAGGNINNNVTSSYVYDNILNYRNTFSKHSIEATAVATRDYRRYESVNSVGTDFALNGNTALGIWGQPKATVQRINMDVDERSNIGYLGRLSYSFDDRYFFTSSYRRDGASVFGANKKWGNFAALGLAWKITNEEFLGSLGPLNNLKLKLSWGQNGNQGIDPYETLSTVLNGSASGNRYEFSNAPGVIYYGLRQDALGNSNLGWESTDTWNVGFESSWLNGRLAADLDVYFSKTTDQIFERNIPVMTGFKTILTSMGQVNNNGLELTLRSVNVRTSKLVWNSSVTYWLNRNKLVRLYGEDVDGDGVEDDDIGSSLFVGKSLGAIYGYEQIGIVQEEDTEYIALTGAAPGAPKYRDLDGVEGITADDRKILGYDRANFRLNLSNTVSYGNFELYAMISGIFGGNNYYLKSNTAAYMTSGTGRFNDNLMSKPYWTPENRSNIYPSAYFAGDGGRYLALQSRGFVRIQDISLAYTFNQPWVEASKIGALKVFCSIQNAATFTDWVGGDPEEGNTVRENIFPVPTTYSLGANLSF